MSEDTTVSFSLEVNVQKAYEDIRRLQTILYRVAGLLRRAGLPEEYDRLIAAVQRTIAALNMLRLTIAAFYASTGPIGWGLALVSLLGTATTAGPVMQEWAAISRDAVSDMQRRGMLPHQ